MPTTIAVRPWPDPVIDTLGHDPRSVYVETFWLPTLGPTSLLLLRHLAGRFDEQPEGVELDVAGTAQRLGLGHREGASSPLVRSLARLEQFDLACPVDDGVRGAAKHPAGQPSSRPTPPRGAPGRARRVGRGPPRRTPTRSRAPARPPHGARAARTGRRPRPRRARAPRRRVPPRALPRRRGLGPQPPSRGLHRRDRTARRGLNLARTDGRRRAPSDVGRRSRTHHRIRRRSGAGGQLSRTVNR